MLRPPFVHVHANIFLTTQFSVQPIVKVNMQMKIACYFDWMKMLNITYRVINIFFSFSSISNKNLSYFWYLISLSVNILLTYISLVYNVFRELTPNKLQIIVVYNTNVTFCVFCQSPMRINAWWYLNYIYLKNIHFVLSVNPKI